MAKKGFSEVEGLIPTNKAAYIFGIIGILFLTGARVFHDSLRMEAGLAFLSGTMFGVSSGLWYLRWKINKSMMKSLREKELGAKEFEGLLPTMIQTISWMFIGMFTISFWTFTTSTFLLIYGAVIMGQGFGWFYTWSKFSQFKQRKSLLIKNLIR